MTEYIVEFDKHEERRIDWWIGEKGRCDIEDPDGRIIERIVRCRDCAKQYQELPNGWKIPCPWRQSTDGFCKWGERREDA